MIEYDHYVRIVVPEPLASGTVRDFFFAVKDSLTRAKIDPKDDIIVIYNSPEEDDAIHRYDVPLTADMTAQEGDRLAHALVDILDTDWELEASTSLEESAQYIQETIIYQE